jgi:hypothetical protein
LDPAASMVSPIHMASCRFAHRFNAMALQFLEACHPFFRGKTSVFGASPPDHRFFRFVVHADPLVLKIVLPNMYVEIRENQGSRIFRILLAFAPTRIKFPRFI